MLGIAWYIDFLKALIYNFAAYPAADTHINNNKQPICAVVSHSGTSLQLVELSSKSFKSVLVLARGESNPLSEFGG